MSDGDWQESPRNQLRTTDPPFLQIETALLTEYSAKEITPTTFAVYAALKTFANNNTGECFPSRAALAKRAHCSVSAVKGSLLRLQELGLVTKEVRMRRDTSEQDTNLYTVLRPSDVQRPGGTTKPPGGTRKPLGRAPETLRGVSENPKLEPLNQTKGTIPNDSANRSGQWTDGQLQGMVRAYAKAMGMPGSEGLAPATKGKAINAFKRIPHNDDPEGTTEDVRGCTAYLMNTAKWSSSIQNRVPGAVVEALPVWINEGRPDAPPPFRQNGNGNRGAAEFTSNLMREIAQEEAERSHR